MELCDMIFIPLDISPEMYQRTYTQKTDVWSAGVTLYVLVAGYPADKLQKAFNLLQCHHRNLKDLPNLPKDMPDSFYDMLDRLLVYKLKLRTSAGDMLRHEFVQFHKSAFSVESIMREAADAANPAGSSHANSMRRSSSIVGSVGRHAMFLDYQNYERSLTALLATMLPKKELSAMIKSVQDRMTKGRICKQGGDDCEREEEQSLSPTTKKGILDVIKVKDIKDQLEEAGHVGAYVPPQVFLIAS
jgi:serine/threonine protein kinase